MTDQQLPDVAVLLYRQIEVADIMQRALIVTEHSSDLDDGLWIANHINRALKILGVYCNSATDEHKRDMEACRSAAVHRELAYIELAKAYQSAAQHLHGADAYEAGCELDAACNGRYRADIAAAIVCGDVDSSLALWAGFFIDAWMHCGGLDLPRELIHVHGITTDEIINYLKKDVVVSALTPADKKQLDTLKCQGATVYRGAIADDPEYRDGLSWTLSKDVAMDFARRHHARDFPAVVYTAELKKDGALLYLSGRDESEVVIDPRMLTITAEISFLE